MKKIPIFVSSLKKSLIVAGAVLALSAGTVQAVAFTGPVTYYFTQPADGNNVYTFVRLGDTLFCYSIEHNAGYASIFKTTQIHNGEVTVTCNNQNKIIQVTN